MKTSRILSALLFSLPMMLAAQSVRVLPTPATPSPSPPGPVQTSRMPDGVAMLNGQVYIIQEGKALPVTEERTMRISPNGMVTGFDGRTWLIPGGQMINADGSAAPVPDFVRDPQASELSNLPTGANANRLSGLAPATGTAPVEGTAGAQQGTTTTNAGAVPNGSRSSGTNRNQGGNGTGLIGVDAVGVPIVTNPGNVPVQNQKGFVNGQTGFQTPPANNQQTPAGTTINGVTPQTGTNANPQTPAGVNPQQGTTQNTAPANTGNASQTPPATSTANPAAKSPGTNTNNPNARPASGAGAQTGTGTGATGNTTGGTARPSGGAAK